MNEIIDKDDVRIFDQKINEICAVEIVRYTCQFFTKENSGMQPFGSGVYVKSKEKYFILTASHVADYLEKDNKDLFIKVEYNKYINVIGKIWMTEIKESNGIDVAIIRIDPKMVPALSKPYLFLPI